MIGIIGTGSMGAAIIDGLLKSKALKPSEILASDKDKKRIKEISKRFHIKTSLDNQKTVKFSGIVILAVKPKDVKRALEETKEGFNSSKLLISIAAGVPLIYLQKEIPDIPIIRVMPNLPLSVREGLIAYSVGKKVKDKEEKIFKNLFSHLGKIIKVNEKKMDVITAISGSGPGYLFRIIEILEEIGIKKGLSKKDASLLANQTFYGTAKLLSSSKLSAGKLRQKVTSSGGTTEAALKVFKKGKLERIFEKAIEAAILRSQQLATGVRS